VEGEDDEEDNEVGRSGARLLSVAGERCPMLARSGSLIGEVWETNVPGKYDPGHSDEVGLAPT
jgi:hypothetical protein